MNIKEIYGLPKSINITYPDIASQEILLATPLILPVSEPAASQVIKTVSSSDLAVFSITPDSVVQTALMYASGINTSGASRTLYWKAIKNGTAVQTGSTTVLNNNYWTMTFYNLYNVAVGDVIELKAWVDSTAGVDLKYYSTFILPTRPIWNQFSGVCLIKNAFATPYLTLTKGNPISEFNGFMYLKQINTSGFSRIADNTANTDLHNQDSLTGMFYHYYGDSARGYAYSSASTTNYPKYARTRLITSISFKETKLKTVYP